jgi:hypothetical protein
MDHARACQQEVETLHAFFQQWFGGELAADSSMFDRFERVLAPGFVMVGPDGVTRERSEVIDMVRRGRGSDPSARIWIEGFQFRGMVGDGALASYQEWQQREGTTRGRVSSVWLRPESAMPHGVQWLHLHETFLPAKDA